MKALDAVLWITSVCVGLWKSQTKTLADIVGVALPGGFLISYDLTKRQLPAATECGGMVCCRRLNSIDFLQERDDDDANMGDV